jgi:hypothetical protein
MGTAGVDGLDVWATWNQDGGFHIEGLHIGGGALVGRDDYEYHITVAKADLPQLANALDCDLHDILEAFEQQKETIVHRGEHRWLTEHDVPSSLWVA